MSEPTTIVVFRKWRATREGPDGDVIALFPGLRESNGHVSSYMHIGQHGAADYRHVIAHSRPATPREYAPLQRELESAPYHYRLEVRRRYIRPRRHA